MRNWRIEGRTALWLRAVYRVQAVGCMVAGAYALCHGLTIWFDMENPAIVREWVPVPLIGFLAVGYVSTIEHVPAEHWKTFKKTLPIIVCAGIAIVAGNFVEYANYQAAERMPSGLGEGMSSAVLAMCACAFYEWALLDYRAWLRKSPPDWAME